MSKKPIQQLHLQKFATKLYEIRRDKELSQSDLARKVWGETVNAQGYSVARNRDLISTYEAGRTVPTRENLEKLAKALGVSVEELAPDLAAERMTKEVPAVSMTMVDGQPGRVHLSVNTFTSFKVASQVIDLLAEAGVGSGTLKAGKKH